MPLNFQCTKKCERELFAKEKIKLSSETLRGNPMGGSGEFSRGGGMRSAEYLFTKKDEARRKNREGENARGGLGGVDWLPGEQRGG